MSKSYPIFVAVIMLIMAVLACCPEPPTPIVKTAVPGEAGESREPATEVPGTQVPIGSSRSNPAPQGSEVEIGDITLAVQGVMRPADDVVAEANMFNDEPAEGNEYLMIEITITCNKGTDETCDISPGVEFELVGSSGIVREFGYLSGIDGMLESGEMFGGATMPGKMLFQVGQDETDLVLIYTELFGMDKAYLALP